MRKYVILILVSLVIAALLCYSILIDVWWSTEVLIGAFAWALVCIWMDAG